MLNKAIQFINKQGPEYCEQVVRANILEGIILIVISFFFLALIALLIYFIYKDDDRNVIMAATTLMLILSIPAFAMLICGTNLVIKSIVTPKVVIMDNFKSIVK